jgi:replicative DNA helicase
MSLYAIPGGPSSPEPTKYSQEWNEILNEYEARAWQSERGLDFGDQQLNDAFFGLQNGIILVAAAPNIGKTALLTHMGWSLANGPDKDKVYVIYFSLDDTAGQIISRIIAMDQRMPIKTAAYPKSFQNDIHLMTKRNQGLKNLQNAGGRFKVLDQRQGESVEWLDQTVRQHQAMLEEAGENRQVVIIIDNFHDLKISQGNFSDEQSAAKYMIDILDKLCKVHRVPVIMSVELKKINGMRRPIPDDIRETVKIQYACEAELLLYNEVGMKGEGAKIYHSQAGGGEKLPVLEARVGKNKFGDFKGRLFWEFFPSQSVVRPVPSEGRKRYATLITV